MTNILIGILIIIILITGIVLLQIFLSKRQSKWLGLVLPGINFIFSLFAAMNLAVFTNTKTQSVQTISEDGKVVNEIINHVQSTGSNTNWASAVISVLMILIICNIPTGILLAIYAACREQLRKNHELEKMNIQDL